MDHEKAIANYTEVLAREPANREAFAGLEKLLFKLGRWEQLIDLYEKTAEAAGGQKGAQLILKAGVIWNTKLKRREKAIECYKRTLEMDPENLSALAHLREHYASTEQWEEYINLLRQEAEGAESNEEKAETLYLVGTTYRDKLGEPGKAMSAFQEAFKTDPKCTKAIKAGMEIYKDLGRWNMVVKLLNIQLKVLKDDEAKAEAYMEMADIYANRMKQTNDAIECYQKVLELTPGNMKALEAMGNLYASAGAGTSLAEGAETAEPTEVTQAPGAAETAAHYISLAEIEMQEPPNLEPARELCEKALAIEPGNARAVEIMEETYRREKRWADLAAFLEKQVEAAPAAERKVELLTKLVMVAVKELKWTKKARNYVVKAIELGGAKDELFSPVLEVYMKSGRYTEYLDMLALKAQYSADDHERASILFEMGDLWREQLKNEEKANEFYLQVLEIEPDNQRAQKLHEDYLRARGDWDALIDVLHRKAEKASTDQERAEHYAEAARLLTTAEDYQYAPEVARPRAIELWEKVLELDPSNQEARMSLPALYRDTGNHEKLLALLDSNLEIAGTDEERVASLREMAEICLEVLGDPQRATEAYSKILQISPQDPEALDAMAHYYREAGEFEGLAQVLENRKATISDTQELLALNEELAYIYIQRLGDTEKAIDTYKQILKLDPENLGALGALEKLFSSRNDWRGLFEVFAKQRELAREPGRRAEIAARAARIATEHPDETGADTDAISVLWSEVLAARPDDPDALAALAKIYEEAGAWEEYVDALARLADSLEDAAERAKARLAAAEAADQKLGEPAKAKEYYRMVLEDDPGQTRAIDMLQKLSAADEDWEGLAEVLELKVSAAEEDDYVSLNMELASLYENKLQRPDDAVGALKRILDLQPDNTDAITELCRILEESEQWDELSEALEKRIEAARELDERLELLRRMAAIKERELGDYGGAAAAYERVLELDPSDADTLEALERIYLEGGEWTQLVRLLGQKSDAVTDMEEKASLLLQTADIYENKMGRKDKAFETYAKLFELGAADDDALAELERLAGELNQWVDLARVMELEADRSQDEDKRNSLLFKVAELALDKLESPDKAVAIYRKILEASPSNQQAHEALVEILRKSGNYQELAEAMEAQAETLSENPEAKAEVLVSLATLYEENLEDTEMAVATYRKVLDVQPGNRDALSALSRIYNQERRWTDLAEVLEREVETTSEVDRMVSLQYQIAGLWERELNQPEKAVKSYHAILDIDPANLPALKSLEKLYNSMEQWQELAGVYIREAELFEEPDIKIVMLSKAANILEHKVSDRKAAIEVLNKVLEIDPDNLPAIRGLQRLYFDKEEWERLIAVYEREIPLEGDISRQVSLYQAIGEIYELKLERAEKAVESYSKILEISGDNRHALQALGRIYEKLGEWELCVQALAKEAAIAPDFRTGAKLHTKVGLVFKDKLGAPDRALEHFQKALELNPNAVDALNAAAGILEMQGRWKELFQLKKIEEKTLQRGEKHAAVLCEIAKIAATKLEDQEEAVAAYKAALESVPDYLPAMLPLAEIYFSRQNWKETAPLLERIVEAEKDRAEPSTLAALKYRQGWALEQLNDLAEARRCYEEAVGIDPNMLQARSALAELLLKEGEKADALPHLEASAELIVDSVSPEEAAGMFYRAGSVAQEVGEADRAIKAFERAVEIDSSHLPSLEALAKAYESAEHWEDAVRVSDILLEITKEAGLRSRLLSRVGIMLLEKLEDPNGAVARLSEAADLAPEDMEVQSSLLQAYKSAGMWQDAVEYVSRLVQAEEDPRRASVLLVHLGDLYRDGLGDQERAVESYHEALKRDPANKGAQDALFAHHEQDGSFGELAERFWSIAEAMQDARTEAKADLLKALGRLYMEKIQDRDKAIEALRKAAELDREDIEIHKALVELYGDDETYKVEAVDSHRALLRGDPLRIDTYHLLAKTYQERGQADRAFCVCAVLNFLKEATPEEKKFYDKHKLKVKEDFESPLEEDVRDRVLTHPDEIEPLSSIYTILSQVASKVFPPDLGAYGIGSEEPPDRDVPPQLLKNFEYVRKTLRLPDVGVYSRERLASMVAVETTEPPSIIVDYGKLKGRFNKEQRFLLGRAVDSARPSHILAAKLGLDGLKDLVRATVKILFPEYGLAGEYDTDEEREAVLARALTRRLRRSLLEPVREYVVRQDEVEWDRYMGGVMHSSNRAGFILCGDVTTAAGVIIRESPELKRVLLKQREDFEKVFEKSPQLRELVLFAVSDEYFELREKAGIAIKG